MLSPFTQELFPCAYFRLYSRTVYTFRSVSLAVFLYPYPCSKSLKHSCRLSLGILCLRRDFVSSICPPIPAPAKTETGNQNYLTLSVTETGSVDECPLHVQETRTVYGSLSSVEPPVIKVSTLTT